MHVSYRTTVVCKVISSIYEVDGFGFLGEEQQMRRTCWIKFAYFVIICALQTHKLGLKVLVMVSRVKRRFGGWVVDLISHSKQNLHNNKIVRWSERHCESRFAFCIRNSIS